jgi:hypothetical protein
MKPEIKLLTEKQAKRMHSLNDKISTGIMPFESELRDTRSVLACGCPESLLRSVVKKNARLAQERRNRRVLVYPRQVHPRQAEIDALLAKAAELRGQANELAVRDAVLRQRRREILNLL